MDQDSLIARYELFVGTATVAAHASALEKGFRQRDVKFFIDLFLNWGSLRMMQEAVTLQNTQVSRFIVGLVQGGYAKKVSRKGPPHYRLTRVGFIELLSRIVHKRAYPEREHFFFLYYFVKSYRTVILDLVKAEGSLFPYSLKVEIEGLLDVHALLQAEISRTERELERSTGRIESAHTSTEFILSSLKAGRKFSELIVELEEICPYELNSEKPMSELIHQFPPAQQQWELQKGNLMRSHSIWEPARTLLEGYLAELKKLKG